MANLTKGQPIQPVGRDGRTYVLPVKATSQLWESAMVAEIGGALVTGTTAGAGNCVGCVTHDALGGSSDGLVRAEVLWDRIFRMKNGVNAVVDSTPIGTVLYMEDDNSVGTGGVGGTGEGKAGYFVGFEDDGFVRVYIGPDLESYIAKNGANLADNATQNAPALARRTRYTFPAMSQNSTVTLTTAGAVVGDVITISRTDASAHTLTVANGGGGAGNLAVLVASKVGFVTGWFDGTNWNLDSCSGT